MNRRTSGITALMLYTTFFFTACGGEEIDSRWLDREITVDGDASEWRGTEQFSDDEKGIRFAVFNDDEDLYICLSTWNTKTQQQILVRGLTFWFDAGGGDRRDYGIEYPMAKGPEEMKSMRGMRETASRDRARAIEELLVRSRSEIKVGRTEDSGGHWMFVEDAVEIGIDAALDMDDRILVLELKVPLAGVDLLPFPGGPAESGFVGLGVEMGKIDVEGMREQMMAGRPQGGMGDRGGEMGGGGPGGGRPGGGGRGGAGMRETMEEEIEAWMKVRLAEAP
jgi:hypothetical protein